MKRSYFVTKSHDMAKPMIELLTDRLEDTEWRMTVSRMTVTQFYATPTGLRRTLSTVTMQLPVGATDTAYYAEAKPISLTKYLSEDAKALAKWKYMQTVALHEHRYQLPGSREYISFLASEAGVFISADCSQQHHEMLSEYYSLANDSTTLYGAFDEDGQLWALEDDSYDYD